MRPQFRERILPMCVQAIHLKRKFDYVVCTHGPALLHWKSWMQPYQQSRRYLLKLKYARDNIPKIWIEEPNIIELAEGKKIPHLYDQKTAELCLFYGHQEWSPSKILADTVIPWAALWLYYFEIWLISGEWTGGGIEH